MGSDLYRFQYPIVKHGYCDLDIWPLRNRLFVYQTHSHIILANHSKAYRPREEHKSSERSNRVDYASVNLQIFV